MLVARHVMPELVVSLNIQYAYLYVATQFIYACRTKRCISTYIRIKLNDLLSPLRTGSMYLGNSIKL